MKTYSDVKINPLSYFKAIIIAVITSLVLILLFALTIKIFDFSDSVINPVNQIIKIISILVGTGIVTRDGQGGIKKGIIIGLTYTFFAFIIFSLLAGKLVINLSFLLDLLFGMLIGVICGIVFVNLRK